MWNFNVVGRRALHFLLLVCILAIFSTGRSVAAVENNQKSTENPAVKRKVSRSYCGITCLYTIMKLAGKEIDYRKLVKPEYIGSPKGSFLSELKKAAEDNGLYAVSVGKLTNRELQPCEISYRTWLAEQRQERIIKEIPLGNGLNANATLRSSAFYAHFVWHASSPHRIGKNWYIVSACNIFGLPIVFSGVALVQSIKVG